MRGFSITDQSGSTLATTQKTSRASKGEESGQKSFLEHMKDGIAEVNKMSITADKMATNLATGKSENIHETMLALSQAEISFKLMVQVRNKALEAYQEIMRMQV